MRIDEETNKREGKEKRLQRMTTDHVKVEMTKEEEEMKVLKLLLNKEKIVKTERKTGMIVQKLRTNAGTGVTTEKKGTDGGKGKKVLKKREAPNPAPKTQKVQNVTEIKVHTRPCTGTAAKTVREGETGKTVKSLMTDITEKNPETGTAGTMINDVKKLTIAKLIRSVEKSVMSSRKRAEEETTGKVNRTVGKRGMTRETAMMIRKFGKIDIVAILRRTTGGREMSLQKRDVTDIGTEDSLFFDVTES